ncbi:MAG TPA: hypothetical protein PK760_06590 [Flavobacteriales bacterium]|nr:hypothetical protein [Flavobacteriales bacterium]
MSFQRWCFLIAALVYLTAAWFGVGYHAEDEFQQVILFAEHLRGHVDLASLPLDYHAHWRSMVQPLICAGVFETCNAISITDPFQLTLVLRLLTAMLALRVTHHFICRALPYLGQEHQHAFIVLSWFLWFLPVLQIRFTGEAWSGLLFLHGLGMLIASRERHSWLIGLCFGAAVALRPAAAFLPLGAVAWSVFVQRADRRRSMHIILGAGAAVLLAAVVDSFAYGEATSTLWNYAVAAISGEEADRFTTLPWYQHLLFAFKYATLPIGLLLITAFVLLATLKPKHVLVWCVTPFLVVHSIMPVKELRFLFPLVPLMPWLLISAWAELQHRWPMIMGRTFWLRLLFPFAVVNVLALIVGITTPAGNGRIKLAQAMRNRFEDQAVHVDQLGDWRQWIPPFFLAPHSTEAFVDRIVIDPKSKPIHLVVAKQSSDLDRIDNMERLAVATPSWSHRFFRWYALDNGYDPLVLYQVHTQGSGH